MINKILPVNTKRRKLVKRTAQKLGILSKTQDYSNWSIERKDRLLLYQKSDLENKPLISLIVPAFNTPEKYLKPLIYSIVAQNYPNWELVLVNASTDEKLTESINSCAEIDTRIKVYEVENQGISANTNFGIDKAQGEYIGFIDHDDMIEPDSLSEVVKAINSNPKAGLIYSDEDKLSEDGKKYSKPHFKPDWSPDLLTHVNYITHFTVIKKELIDKIGGLDSDKDGAQDYDLILKATDTGTEVVHVPKVLYHWREARSSTAESILNKPYIKQAGKRALEDHYKRIGLKVEVKPLAAKPGFYKPEFLDINKPTVIITQFANKALVDKYIKILTKKRVLEGLEVIKDEDSIKDTLQRAGKAVIIINDFLVPENKHWAQELAGVLKQSHVHSAAPVILRPNRDIEDAGIAINKYEKTMLFRGYEFGVNTYFGDTDWTRNVDELTGNVAAVRTDEFKKFINENPVEDIRTLLNKYSQKAGDKFNAVIGTTPFIHARTSQALGKSRFMNPNIIKEGIDFNLYPNDKQIMDALEKLERESE